MRSLLLAILAVPALASAASASVAVLVHTGDEVVVAADSIGLDKDGKAMPEKFCKLAIHSDVVVAHTGLVEAAALRWNLPRVIARRLAETRDAPLRNRIDDVMGAVSFQFALRQLELEADPDLDAMLSRTLNAVTLLFAGVDSEGHAISAKGNLKVRERRENVATDVSADHRQRIDYEIVFCAEECAERVFLGGQEAALRSVRRDPANAALGGLELAQSLVDGAIARVPGLADAPVDILRIRPGRIEWVERKPECEAAPARAR